MAQSQHQVGSDQRGEELGEVNDATNGSCFYRPVLIDKERVVVARAKAGEIGSAQNWWNSAVFALSYPWAWRSLAPTKFAAEMEIELLA